MAADLAAQLEVIARHLRAAGDGLDRQLAAAIRRGVTPVTGQIRAGLAPRMPNRYAATLNADLNLKVSVITSEHDPRVTLTGQTRSGKRRRLRRLEGGVLEHPLWGDREHWYKQDVTPGWFTGPARDAAPRIRAEIEQVLEAAAEEATRKGL